MYWENSAIIGKKKYVSGRWIQRKNKHLICLDVPGNGVSKCEVDELLGERRVNVSW